MMFRLSLGSNLNKRQGPFIASCFGGSSAAGVGGLPFEFRAGNASDGVAGVGEATNCLNELSVRRGAFHGNRRSDMHAKMIANDHISAGWGSYLRLSYTSGARYGSEPTIPAVSQ